MDITVVISAGTFNYEVSVTDTGPDGISEAQTHATTHFLALVGEDACHVAAKARPTLTDGDDD